MPRASKRKLEPLKSSKVDGLRSASNKATMKKGEPIDDLFHSYVNRSLGMIDPEGIETLRSDLGVDHTDVRILMLAWKMNAQKQGYFTQETQLAKRPESSYCYTVNKLKNALSELENEVRMPQNFADFYSFAFQYCLTDYLKIQNDYKVINMDQWTSFLQFCHQISFPDLKNYDTTEAWPLILDDFVEWMREEKLATTES
ncbi:unnamed protein product [Camellia sinensis]